LVIKRFWDNLRDRLLINLLPEKVFEVDFDMQKQLTTDTPVSGADMAVSAAQKWAELKWPLLKYE
jgi:hypothetical protein